MQLCITCASLYITCAPLCISCSSLCNTCASLCSICASLCITATLSVCNRGSRGSPLHEGKGFTVCTQSLGIHPLCSLEHISPWNATPPPPCGGFSSWLYLVQCSWSSLVFRNIVCIETNPSIKMLIMIARYQYKSVSSPVSC